MLLLMTIYILLLYCLVHIVLSKGTVLVVSAMILKCL